VTYPVTRIDGFEPTDLIPGVAIVRKAADWVRKRDEEQAADTLRLATTMFGPDPYTVPVAIVAGLALAGIVAYLAFDGRRKSRSTR
jgi:hypothetical protein